MPACERPCRRPGEGSGECEAAPRRGPRSAGAHRAVPSHAGGRAGSALRRRRTGAGHARHPRPRSDRAGGAPRCRVPDRAGEPRPHRRGRVRGEGALRMRGRGVAAGSRRHSSRHRRGDRGGDRGARPGPGRHHRPRRATTAARTPCCARRRTCFRSGSATTASIRTSPPRAPIGIEPAVVERAGLGLDIDTPDDLEAFLASPSDTRTYRLLTGRTPLGGAQANVTRDSPAGV